MAANREEGIADEVLDQLLEGRDPATVFETGGFGRRAEEAAWRSGCSMPRWTIIWVRRRRKKPAITAMAIAQDRSDGYGQTGTGDSRVIVTGASTRC